MHDPRARQALMLAKQSPKSSLTPGRGRAIVWLIGTIIILGGAIWVVFSMI